MKFGKSLEIFFIYKQDFYFDFIINKFALLTYDRSNSIDKMHPNFKTRFVYFIFLNSNPSMAYCTVYIANCTLYP